jgi:hypothetical protein
MVSIGERNSRLDASTPVEVVRNDLGEGECLEQPLACNGKLA